MSEEVAEGSLLAKSDGVSDVLKVGCFDGMSKEEAWQNGWRISDGEYRTVSRLAACNGMSEEVAEGSLLAKSDGLSDVLEVGCFNGMCEEGAWLFGWRISDGIYRTVSRWAAAIRGGLLQWNVGGFQGWRMQCNNLVKDFKVTIRSKSRFESAQDDRIGGFR
jgi:hypothetical protein